MAPPAQPHFRRAATGICFAVYLPPRQWVHWNQSLADNLGLLVGAGAQFIGARYFVFRARQGKVHRQLAGFVLAEIATPFMNVLMLWLGRNLLPTAIAQSDLIVLVTTFAVFACLSYPARHLVFRRPKAGVEATG